MLERWGKGPLIGGTLILLVIAGAVGWALTSGSENKPDRTLATVTVYKSPSCGCCAKWAEHMEDHGFAVEVIDTDELRLLKSQHGITPALAACHTALVDGYVVEGHVPADLVEKLLNERPAVAGLVVPGMPVGSPGMEGPRRAPYEVLTLDREGNTEQYAIR